MKKLYLLSVHKINLFTQREQEKNVNKIILYFSAKIFS